MKVGRGSSPRPAYTLCKTTLKYRVIFFHLWLLKMQDLPALCRYPALSEHYNQSLREAVAYILSLADFDIVGIIAAGSIIRGTPNATSDFDIYVIQTRPQRQLIHRIFNGVATQIFINPPHRVRRYFEDERGEARCTAAHMLATGFVVLDRDPVVEQLRQEARDVLQGKAEINAGALMMARYHALDKYENALDMAEISPEISSMIAYQAVYDMLHYLYLSRQEFLPRDKDLLKRLESDFPQVAPLAKMFYSAPDLPTRLEAAGQIADLTIETRLFFEMESTIQDV